MSPASQATLQVEQYIGSYLISQRNKHYSNHHVKQTDADKVRSINRYAFPRREPHVVPTGWAGVPLISVADRRPKNAPRSDDRGQDRSPLTRLAIHTQGAPLIQAGRYNNRCRNNRGYHGEPTAPATPSKERACSDESSTGSENSLPRIIKPRKRRKKDRKPAVGTASATANETVRCSGEEDTLKTFTGGNVIPERDVSAIDTLSEDLIDPLTSADGFPFGNLLDDEEEECDDAIPATVCQCRYCDPSGVIWDVDRRCYSPFLTPPTDPPRTGGLQVSSEIITSPNGHRDIEIKFYSSSAPLDTIKGKFSDRYYATEE